MRNITLSLFILVLFMGGIMLYTTCDDSSVARRGNSPPVIDDILANPENMLINAICSLQVVASDADGDSLRYQWSADQGTFTTGTKDTIVSWQAPAVPGVYMISVAVSDDDSTVTGNKVLNVTSTTELSVTPTSLSFDAGTDTLFLTIENTGTGTMAYQLSKINDWLILSKESGSLTAQRRDGKTAELAASSEQITVSVNRAGITAGTYTDVITVISDGGTKQIPITMQVSEGPVLSVSETTLNFSTDQTQMTFNVTNSGEDTLNWQATASETWIIGVTPENGDCGAGETDQVTVTVDRTGLNDGTYTGTVAVTSDAGNVTVNVIMGVGVVNNAVLLVTPTLLSFSPSQTQMVFNVINTGLATLNWQAGTSEAWIAGLTPENGDCDPGETDEVTVTVDRTGLDTGVYTGIIVVTSDAGSDTVDVQMGVNVDSNPVLLVTPENLNFGLSTTDLSFLVTNIGEGTLNWQATASEAWITGVTPGNGDCDAGETDQVSVTVDRSGLGTGTYSGMVVVTSDAGSDTVNVQMEVNVQNNPVLLVTPTDLDFGLNSTERTFLVSNMGQGTLNWQATASEAWITGVTPDNGDCSAGETDQVSVTVDRSGLGTGTYTGMIVVTSNAGSDTVNVQMEVEVVNNPVLSVTPTDLDFGTNGTELTLEITNTGDGTLSWNIGTTESWLTCDPVSGSVTTGTAEVIVTVDRTGLPEGDYNDIIPVTSNDGSVDVNVDMTVSNVPLDDDFSGDLSGWTTSYANGWIDNGEAHVKGTQSGYYGTLKYMFDSPISAEYDIKIKMARASSGSANDCYGLWVQTADTGDVSISYFVFWIRPFDYTNNYYIMVYVSGDFPAGPGWYFIDSQSYGYFSYIKMGLNEWNELSWQVREDGRINLRIGDALFYNTDLVSWIKTDLGITLETEIIGVGLRTTYDFEAKMDEISVMTPGSVPAAAADINGSWMAYPDNEANRLPPLPEDFSQIKSLSDFIPEKKLK